MKLSKKLFTAGIVSALTLSVAASALAAELTVKTKKINEGQVKIATPVITGSEGGAKMDTLLTQMTTKNTVAEIYKYLSSDSQKITLDNYLDFTNGSPDPVKEGFALVKGSAFLVNAGFDKEQKALGKTQAAEKYRLDIDYTAYTVDSEILSLEQYASAYTGGAHDNESITTLTVNPKTGRIYTLADMFVPGSDYKARLEMLIAIQQKGDNRLLEQMKKPTVAYQKVIISGNEKFYLNSDLDNWGIYVVYNPGEVAPMAAGIQKYYLPIFSFRQLSQQLQLTAVIKADATDGDLPFYSIQITAQQADSFRFELVKAEQFFQTATALRGQSQVIVETAALEQHTVVIENLDRSLQSGNSFGRDII